MYTIYYYFFSQSYIAQFSPKLCYEIFYQQKKFQTNFGQKYLDFLLPWTSKSTGEKANLYKNEKSVDVNHRNRRL